MYDWVTMLYTVNQLYSNKKGEMRINKYSKTKQKERGRETASRKRKESNGPDSER